MIYIIHLAAVINFFIFLERSVGRPRKESLVIDPATAPNKQLQDLGNIFKQNGMQELQLWKYKDTRHFWLSRIDC